MRRWIPVVAVAVCVACGGSGDPLAPTTAPAAPASNGSASALGKGRPAPGEGFYVLVVQCQPKGDKRAHFDVSPASGPGPSVQLRCKGQADLHGPGPWVVRPKSDTDQSYVCSPSPITVKEEKARNRVVCSKH